MLLQRETEVPITSSKSVFYVYVCVLYRELYEDKLFYFIHWNLIFMISYFFFFKSYIYLSLRGKFQRVYSHL